MAAIPFPVSKIEGLGLMKVDDDLSITEFAEKPTEPAVIESLTLSDEVEAKLESKSGEKHCLASMGIYVFNRKALIDALDNTMTDFGKEVIPSLLGQKKLCAHIFEGYWEDIGTVKAFFEANLALAQPMPPFNFFDPVAPIYTEDRYLPASKLNKCAMDHAVIGDGAILIDSSFKRCVIGSRSFVDEGSVLEDVVLMGADSYETIEQLASNTEAGEPRLGVGKNCQIKGAIIDKNARIGDGCVLNVTDKLDGRYADGEITIRDGVLVVPKGALIPAGTVV
jgi:glucose-1-phosphate adenylyltransferase